MKKFTSVWDIKCKSVVLFSTTNNKKLDCQLFWLVKTNKIIL